MSRQNNNETLPLVLSERTFPIIEQVTAGMPGGFFIYHADGDEELIYANQALIDIFGCSDLEDFKAFTGYTFQGLVHPEDLERVEESIYNQIAKDGNDLDYVEYRVVRKDGGVRWLQDFGHFVHTKLYGDVFYVFVEDATERHLKEHETTALHMVHEILSSGMWSMEFNERGEMVSVLWSDEFRAMLGYQDTTDFPDLLESWSDLLHKEDKERVLKEYYDTIADYTGKKTYDVEYRLLTKNRGWRWFRATGRLSRRADGSPITYIGMFVDITRRKMTDEALATQRRLLEEALEQAQQANQSKTAFLKNMSHDIRTPMNAIVGFTTLASMYIDDKEMVTDYLDKIMSASNNLLSMINDVLDMSRMESGEVRMQTAPCSLSHILRDLDGMIKPEVRAKQLDFSVEMTGLVHEDVVCDRKRLNQVLMNVSSNAVKFTPPRGKITVQVDEIPGAPAGYGFYVFKIRDTGIGMSREFVEHIFEPFERERTSTLSGAPGTGLGMTITKNIVDMMSGTIRVESEEGKGTEFTISLQFPLAEKTP